MIEGFEIGRVYEAGTGMMAGDFYDLYRTHPSRFAAVIGDVSGHGIEASITAFQVKYLLRTFLRQFRDPAQALEELNAQISDITRHDEFVSLVVAVFDLAGGTLRYASAGHPAAWLWNDGEVRPLRATGPLLTLDPRATIETLTAFIGATGNGDLPTGSVEYKTIFAVGLTLFAMTFVMNVLSTGLVRRFREVYD